jgi:pimeloyl-ACP methyl ester carboxylesterase
MPSPVILVHGWAGSFASTWEPTGLPALLSDAGRRVIGVDLLGHGTAPKPHDPAEYADLASGVIVSLPDEGPVDAVGFSLGALTLLRAAVAVPHRFSRIVLAGIGRNVFEPDETQTLHILAALEGTAPPDDNEARLFATYASESGNDPVALAAVLRARHPLITEQELATVRCPVLVAVGDRDFVYPADRLVAALPDAKGVVLPNTDHFATPKSFALLDAVLDFLDAQPD